MPETIIADTSCFILLTKINELDLLQKLYGQITTTDDVATEFGHPFPAWVSLKNPSDGQLQKVLELQIDRGEASAIALALETPDSTVILDDYRARKVAEQLKLKLTGTVGVIIKAKRQGIIASIKPFLQKINQTDFRLTKTVEGEALRQAGEAS